VRLYSDSSSSRGKPVIRSPKRKKPTEECERIWYEYHASFSAGFVEDVIGHLSLPSASTILDPWNGTGITTYVAQRKGYGSVGVDLSPVMVLVAKARHIEANALSHLRSLMSEVISLAKNLKEGLHDSEPLLSWFDVNSALTFRKLEQAVRVLLVGDKVDVPLFYLETYANVSSLAALFYVALFRTLRQTLAPFVTSNPTWIKTPKLDSEKLDVTWESVVYTFAREIEVMTAVLETSYAQSGSDNAEPYIAQGTSTSLPLDTGSVGAVISSPPYCTRIDYAVATLPELHLLGCTDKVLKSLRDQMIGTPTMSGNIDPGMMTERTLNWGSTATSFLKKVRKHDSKASSTYYMRYFMQYFDSIEHSLQEISRVLEPHSPCVLVVQDSHYKEVHLDLADIFTEIAENSCLRLQQKLDFPNGSSLARINKGTRRYREKVNAIESVLVLKKK
jgi:SAM-dependent methyltransferase